MAPRSLLPAIFLALPASVNGFFPPNERRTVDTTYPYKGAKVPVGDWVNNGPNDNGRGFPRLVEAPAVTPSSESPTNNVNVVSLSYVPGGMNVHFQTPFGLGEAPTVKWGVDEGNLDKLAVGSTETYPRTPSCSEITAITQCSEFYHNVQLTNLAAGKTYYYQILPANGTTISPVLSFTTALAAGSDTPFTVAIMNDMGYTNAQGTYEQLTSAISHGAAFMWHGGDISYADDWYSGILPCEDSWPVCYNGTSTRLPEGDYPEDYNTPLPEGEIPGQGSPRGGDMSVLYESNWDLWQQWMSPLTSVIPHMVLPGNHEASCAEFDGQGNIMTAYLNEGIINGTAEKSSLTYFSCPPSQRNFTAFSNRFRMPGEETDGVGNFWYSFDYGLAHFVSLNSETDFAYSPSWPFIRENKGKLGTPAENATFITECGTVWND